MTKNGIVTRKKEDEIFEEMLDLAQKLNRMNKLYPRSMFEICKNEADIELDKFWRHNKPRLTATSLRKLAMAQLIVDLVKNEQKCI